MDPLFASVVAVSFVPKNCRPTYTLDLEKNTDLHVYRAPREERPLE